MQQWAQPSLNFQPLEARDKYLNHHWDFSGGPVVKTSTSNAGDVGLIPDPGTKYPHASWPKKQNVKQKRHCNKFKKDFENGPLQKKMIF